MLVTSILSFSHNVFYPIKELLVVFGFNPFPNKPWFLRVSRTSLLKTLWEKEKLLVTSNISFSHNVFYSIKAINHLFGNIQFVVCKYFQFGHVQNSVVWERVNITLTAKVISWWSVTHIVFPGFITPVLTQLFFPKPPTTFLTCFCRGERRKYAGKKVPLNLRSYS